MPTRSYVHHLFSLAQCQAYIPDFSVVLFRPHFMLVSEGHPMKVHKNQWFLDPLPPPDIPWGATNQGIPHGA